jgi:capsular polysaccharide biosynthesis protein
MTGYSDFADAVRGAGRTFEMDLDENHLATIAALFQESVGDPADPREEWRVTATGWLRRGVSFPFASAAERRAGSSARLRRFARPEFGWRGRLIRHGFHLETVVPGDPLTVSLVASARDRILRPLHASNSTAAEHLVAIGSVAASADSPVVGYVDRVTIAPRPYPDGRGWLEAIVCETPDALWDFVQSTHGEPWRARLLAGLDLHPANARWADRFRLVLHGLDAEFRSTLQPLRVVRLDLTDDDPARTLQMPALVHDGAMVIPAGDPVRFPAPNPAWHRFDDVALQDGGLVTRGGNLLLYEEAADPRRDFVSGTWQTLFGNSVRPEAALLDRRPTGGPAIPEAILIGGRNDFNWFHWCVEYMPRVFTIPADVADDVPLLVSSRTPDTGLDALKRLTDRPIETVDAASSRDIGLLHVAAPVAQVLDSPRVTTLEGFAIDVPALTRLREEWCRVAPDRPAERRVFLRRRTKRRGILNEDRLAEMARAEGFEIVDPGRLSFDRQLELYSSTSVLVGASGAVMVDYLMLPPRARVLALTSTQLWDFVLPAAISAIADVDFAYLTGATTTQLHDATDRNSWLHSDFVIDTDEFARALAWATGTSTRPERSRLPGRRRLHGR